MDQSGPPPYEQHSQPAGGPPGSGMNPPYPNAPPQDSTHQQQSSYAPSGEQTFPPPPQDQSYQQNSYTPPAQQTFPPPPQEQAYQQGSYAPAQQNTFPPPPQDPTNHQGLYAPTAQHDAFPPPPQDHNYQQSSYAPATHGDDYPPPPQMPPRPNQQGSVQQYDPSSYAPGQQHGSYIPPPPPQRHASPAFNDDDPANPISFIRDPHKLVAYLVPFPKPRIGNVDPATVPTRFLIYTPPPPPLARPAEGAKEGKVHKVQRKWQEEVRTAKTSTAKTASWKGVKGKATKGISWAIDRTTSSNLDFLGRVSDGNKSDSGDEHAKDGVMESETTKKTVGVDEMVLVYPATMTETPDQLKAEFVDTMLRTKTKAQRDAVISTGLMPVAYGIDILATFVWPFGGLGEIDTVWAYANIRGAKTARSVTKRLSSTSTTGNHEEDKLKLNFVPSSRLQVLRGYLDAECHKVDPKLFQSAGISASTDTMVLSAIGWAPSEREKNWEDEQWEMEQVKEDLRNVMHKGAKEWNKWCKAFEKNPEKALKK